MKSLLRMSVERITSWVPFSILAMVVASHPSVSQAAAKTSEVCIPNSDQTEPSNSVETLLNSLNKFEETKKSIASEKKIDFAIEAMRFKDGVCTIDGQCGESVQEEIPKNSSLKENLKDALMVISKIPSTQTEQKSDSKEASSPLLRARMLSEDSKLIQVDPESKEVTEVQIPQELHQKLKSMGAQFDASGRYLELSDFDEVDREILKFFEKESVQIDQESSKAKIDLDQFFQRQSSKSTNNEPLRSSVRTQSFESFFETRKQMADYYLDPINPKLCSIIEENVHDGASNIVIECIRRGWMQRQNQVTQTSVTTKLTNYFTQFVSGISNFMSSNLSSFANQEDQMSREQAEATAEASSDLASLEKAPSTNSVDSNSSSKDSTTDSKTGAANSSQTKAPVDSKALGITEGKKAPTIDPVKSMADSLTALGIIRDKEERAQDSKFEEDEIRDLDLSEQLKETKTESSATKTALKTLAKTDFNKTLSPQDANSDIQNERLAPRPFRVVDGYLVLDDQAEQNREAPQAPQTPQQPNSSSENSHNGFSWPIPPFVLPERRKKAAQQ